MNQPIRTINYRNAKILIYVDDDAQNPIEFFGCCCGEPECNGAECQKADYQAWANGDVYGYVIKHDWIEDSCWGFYGCTDYAIESAKEQIDYYLDRVITDSEYSRICAL